jgi:hypothetical protein
MEIKEKQNKKETKKEQQIHSDLPGGDPQLIIINFAIIYY